jgi:hypothetical protein
MRDMTPHPHHRRRLAAATLAALCLPLPTSALAIPQSEVTSDYPSAASVRQPVRPAVTPAVVSTKAGDTPADYPGSAGSPAVAKPTSEAIAPVAATTSDGLDWTSAAIGAGAGVLFAMALGAGAVARRHHGLRPAR